MPTQKPSFLKRVWQLMRPYWKSEERWMARWLLLIITALNLSTVYLKVQFNYWHNDFYNSLQNYDEQAFIHNIIKFSWLSALWIVAVVYATYLLQMLRIKWRRWLTEYYLNNWLHKQNYYRMQLFSNLDNPDQRISQDIEDFIRITLSLMFDGLNSVVTLFSFLFILWALSGPLDFVLSGMNIHIPGYLLWVAFLYAALGTWLTFRIGRPLAKLNFDQQHFEADFRFNLVRLRENSENVAFYKGEAAEGVGFKQRFSAIIGNWWQIMRRQKKINWFTSGYGQVAEIFPYVVVAPRFFAKKITLGTLMQTAEAFGQVQDSLSFLVNSFVEIANWKAVADRLSGFNESVGRAEALQQVEGLNRRVTAEKKIETRGLTIRLPDGKPLLENINIALGAGDTLLVSGISGSGKSTLLRTLAGIWPFVEGEITMPGQARMLFVPQKPYLPLGTLAQVLCYPEPPAASEAEMKEVLSLCQLEHLVGRLGDTDQWSHILSLGEQQRLAFARVLITKPDFAFLDEAGSAIDDVMEAQLYGLLKARLPGMAVVSVAHHAALRAWHKTELKLGGKI